MCNLSLISVKAFEFARLNHDFKSHQALPGRVKQSPVQV